MYSVSRYDSIVWEKINELKEEIKKNIWFDVGGDNGERSLNDIDRWLMGRYDDEVLKEFEVIRRYVWWLFDGYEEFGEELFEI